MRFGWPQRPGITRWTSTCCRRLSQALDATESSNAETAKHQRPRGRLRHGLHEDEGKYGIVVWVSKRGRPKAGKGIAPSGYFQMTEVVQSNCRADWDGGICTSARFLWNWKAWPAGQCVTPAGKVYVAKQQ